jgi:biotin carboxyl carrier protein
MFYKKSTHKQLFFFISLIGILGLHIFSLNAFAHGDGDHDHDHDESVKKVKPKSQPSTKAPVVNSTEPTISAIPKYSPAINSASVMQNHNTQSFNLNAKAVVSPSAMRYVYSPIDGLITIKQMINAGDFVKKGQLLAYAVNVIQPIDTINQQQQIQVLQGQLNQEKQNLNRLNLVPDLVPKKDIDIAKTNIQNLQQQIQKAQKPLQQKLPIYSPINGFVVSSILDANKQIDSKQVLVSISNSQIANEIQANYFINPQQKIKPNSNINAYINNMPDIALKYLGYLPQANHSVVLRFAIPAHLVERAGLWINQAVQVSIQPMPVNATNAINPSNHANSLIHTNKSENMPARVAPHSSQKNNKHAHAH